MKTSAAGIALIKEFEGCRREAYPDPGPQGWNLPTIGYGHTRGVERGDRISQAQADAFLVDDLMLTEQEVEQAVRILLTQGQFDALVSFAYNVQGWRTSTLLRKVNVADRDGAASEFARWAHAGGVILPGLVRRRAAERALFLS